MKVCRLIDTVLSRSCDFHGVLIDENRDVLHGAVSWLVDIVRPGNVEDAEDADRPNLWFGAL